MQYTTIALIVSGLVVAYANDPISDPVNGYIRPAQVTEVSYQTSNSATKADKVSGKTPVEMIRSGFEVTVPRSDGMFRVKGYVDRVPVTFLVDSGAYWVQIAASKMGDISRFVRLGEGKLRTASGQQLIGYVYEVPSINVGTITLEDVEVFVAPDGTTQPSTLLGLSFLNRLQSWRYSSADDMIVLQK